MRPTVRSRRLGARLSQYRQTKGMSGSAVASELGIQQPQYSRIESGKTQVTPKTLEKLVGLFDIPADVHAVLDEMRRRCDEPGWWQAFGDILAEPVEALIELETEASWISTWDVIIPGLLQTRPYAERIITASSPHLRVGDIDRYLELRLRRQKRLADGMRLTAVVSELAIRQQVGGPQVLHDQLEHIARTVHDHDVTVQVVPFTADAHAAMGDQFAIIQWPDEESPEAVYVDGQTSWTIHERGGVIRQYVHAFAAVQAQALDSRDSLDLIHSVMQELSK